MKVRIQQRSVYHKFAEVEIEIDKNDFQDYLRVNNAPKGATAEDYISDYLIDNEHLYTDSIDDKISKASYEFGFGTDYDANTHYNSHMIDSQSESEWRYECDELKIGGHL
ncbi:MAG: hypothetical protein GY920_06035 [Aliivibrio sp.]|nr:hypothetical protein [Aliivibrio sp.]MCP4163514.1 hypothetical protein [Deltaproteobacteria bacterium]